MKIEMTLEFPDAARRYIAALASDGPPEGSEHANSKGMATREACIAYMRSLVARIDEDGSILPTKSIIDRYSNDAKFHAQVQRAVKMVLEIDESRDEPSAVLVPHAYTCTECFTDAGQLHRPGCRFIEIDARRAVNRGEKP